MLKPHRIESPDKLSTRIRIMELVMHGSDKPKDDDYPQHPFEEPALIPIEIGLPENEGFPHPTYIPDAPVKRRKKEEKRVWNELSD